MHLERNILKGKFGNNKELKKEAREEIAEHNAEEKAETPYFKGGKHPKVKDMAKKMKVKSEGKPYKFGRYDVPDPKHVYGQKMFIKTKK